MKMQELIDRRKLLNTLCKECGHCKNMEEAEQGSANPCSAHRIISEQPIIEAEPMRRGRWINDKFCSECGRFPVDVSVSISNQELTKYFSRCPHCGSKNVRGEENETEGTT